MTAPDSDPLALAHSYLLDAAAWLHSVGTAPGLDEFLAGEANAAADEVMHLLEAYEHLWGAPIADPG